MVGTDMAAEPLTGHQMTADLARRLRTYAGIDDNPARGDLLYAAAAAIDSLTAERDTLNGALDIASADYARLAEGFRARLAAAERMVAAAREATLWHGDKYIEDLTEAIALYDMPLDTEKAYSSEASSEAETWPNPNRGKSPDLNFSEHGPKNPTDVGSDR